MTAAPVVPLPLPAAASPDDVLMVGVEEEFMLVRPDGDAAWIAPELLGRLPEEVRVRTRVAGYRVESASGVCAELATIARDLSVTRRVLAEAAADHGARMLAVGTLPFGASAAEVTCACHVTVELPDPALGVAVLERLQPWLPALLALTGNSPLWRGRDTGWSSHRFAVQRRRPTVVPRPRSGDAAACVEPTGNGIAASAATDAPGAHVLARLSPGRLAVEIRLSDTCPSVPDAVLLAGLCRALVGTAVDDERAGRPMADVPARVLGAVAWAAARRGLTAPVVSLRLADLAPAHEVLDELVTAVAPALEAAGDMGLLSDLLADRLRRGSGAERQRALWRLGGREVFVQALANLCAGVEPAALTGVLFSTSECGVSRPATA